MFRSGSYRRGVAAMHGGRRTTHPTIDAPHTHTHNPRHTLLMKRYADPVEVLLSRGSPRRVRWAERIYQVQEILDFWIYQSRWWSSEERRIYFRLRTNRGTIEIWRSGEQWVLAGVED